MSVNIIVMKQQAKKSAQEGKETRERQPKLQQKDKNAVHGSAADEVSLPGGVAEQLRWISCYTSPREQGRKERRALGHRRAVEEVDWTEGGRERERKAECFTPSCGL